MTHTQKDHVWDYRSAVRVQRVPQLLFSVDGCNHVQAGRSINEALGTSYQFDRYFREEKDAISCLMFSNVASLALCGRQGCQAHLFAITQFIAGPPQVTENLAESFWKCNR
jgi:hypothetical protein